MSNIQKNLISFSLYTFFPPSIGLKHFFGHLCTLTSIRGSAFHGPLGDTWVKKGLLGAQFDHLI